MGAAGIALAAFLAFSVAISWVAGDKQQERLEDKIAMGEVTQRELKNDISGKERQLATNARQIDELQRKYRKEARAKKRIERKLAFEKRKQRMAVAGATEDEPLESDRDKNREKMRAELAAQQKLEIARLEEELAAAEEAKEKIKSEMRLRIEEEASRKAQAALAQAELARVKAEEATLKAQSLQESLQAIEIAKKEIEESLMEMARIREVALAELEEEKAKRGAMEFRLREVEASYSLAVKTLEETRAEVVAADTEAAALTTRAGAKEEAEQKGTLAREKMASLQEDIKRLRQERIALSDEASAHIETTGDLQAEVAASRENEAALKSAEAERKTLIEMSRGAEADKERLGREYEAKVALLEEKLAAAAAARTKSDQDTSAEIARLQAKADDLTSMNRGLEQDIRKTMEALAEASAEGEAARELMTRNAELKTKLKEAGLVGLQGRAASYMAQKIVEGNAALEKRLATARQNLARAEAARDQAEAGMDNTRSLTARLKEAEVMLAKNQPLTGVVDSLKARNAELERKFQVAEEAMAQAEGARSVIGELQARNRELTKQLTKELAVAAGGGTQPVRELELATKELAGKLKEARLAKEAGEQALQAITTARLETEKKLEEESRARTALERKLDEALRASKEKEGEREEEIARLETAKQQLEEKLREQTEAMTRQEAKLSGSTAGDDVTARIDELNDTLKAAREEVARERAAKRELETELTRVRFEAETLMKLSGVDAPTDLASLRAQLAGLKETLTEKLKSGELTSDDVLSFMRVDSVISFYVVEKGDSLWKIAGREDVYGDPFLWPLLYRYNLTKIDEPDIIDVQQVIVIYKDVTQREKRDAVKKAQLRGDWRNWSAAERKAWIEDWVR